MTDNELVRRLERAIDRLETICTNLPCGAYTNDWPSVFADLRDVQHALKSSEEQK